MTRPFVMADAVPSRTLRKVGATLINALWIAAATIPIGAILFAAVSAAFVVATTKVRKTSFH